MQLSWVSNLVHIQSLRPHKLVLSQRWGQEATGLGRLKSNCGRAGSPGQTNFLAFPNFQTQILGMDISGAVILLTAGQGTVWTEPVPGSTCA